MDDLQEMHPDTRGIVAEADVVRHSIRGDKAAIAKFAGLMFKAGFTECQRTIEFFSDELATKQ